MENAARPVDDLRKIRIGKLEKIKRLGVNPYPSGVPDKIPVEKARDSIINTEVNVAGRAVSFRSHGKISFVDLKDESGQIQLAFKQDVLTRKLWDLLALLDIGDFLWVTGTLFNTKAGELTILVSEYELLTKSVRPIPSAKYGLKDEEERYRQRYVDLFLNEDLKETFRRKALFWSTVRRFLVDRGFLEVETPVLEVTAGGADANPFVTHHNALNIDLYLRISMGELWQKRLMVAGFEKTFEIGRQFRNEGISKEHLQDYTQMEFYWAYADYEDSMRLVEEMYKKIAEEVYGTLKFNIGNREVDLSKKWERLDYSTILRRKFKINVATETEASLRKLLKELDMPTLDVIGKGRMLDLLWKQARKEVTGPAFLVGHPVEVSPLAKRMEGRLGFVERYQVIIAGSELGNGYSELNDPIDQRKRFEEQQKMREKGDKEAQMYDFDFVRALEYGMPPVTGFGVSERLFAFLEGKPVREAVLFPLLRPEEKNAGY